MLNSMIQIIKKIKNCHQQYSLLILKTFNDKWFIVYYVNQAKYKLVKGENSNFSSKSDHNYHLQ